jgi:hypothetical protein
MAASGRAQQVQEDPYLAVFLEEPVSGREALEAAGPDYYLISVSAPAQLGELKRAGLHMVRRLDLNTAVFRLESSGMDALSITDLRLWKINDQWKLSDNLLRADADAQASYVVKFTDREVLTELNRLGMGFRLLRPGLAQVQSTLHKLKSNLLQNSAVVYIGSESASVVMESRVLDLNLNPNTVNRIHHAYPGLRGQGMVLSIREGMFDTSDMDLRRRHLASALEGDEPTNHATEMATIAAGAGNSSLNGRGVAGSAALTGSLLRDLLPDANADYSNLNAWVQNHSYGTSEVENFYGAFAQAYDQSAQDNPTLLHVFSAGNLGTSAPESGVYAGNLPVANMTGNFKMSKNTLAVASVDTVGREVTFVSRGPAHDGRIKPELVTYSVAGSSNSAALTSGVSVLLQQAYQEEHGTLPPSALLKALLINSAQDVANPGPDYVTGYGNLDAYAALNTLKEEQFFTGTLSDGESETFGLNLPANAINIKVSLVWNDPAAPANSNIALVNDLDLSVDDGAGQTYLPWVLNPDPDHLGDAAVRATDRLNNVEQVTLAGQVSGVIDITVSAFDIPEGSQEFYLAYQWQESEVFEWTFPTGSDNMPYNGETVSYFRWQSSLSAVSGRLEYSIDGGASWTVIDSDVALARGYYRWDAPLVRSEAIARMVVDNVLHATEAFTISRPERVGVGFSCADSVRLQWPDLPEAEAYEIFTFGEAFLEPVATVTDSSFTFNKSDFDTRLFSVQPVLANGVRPVRSATLDYDFQGVGCYLVSFFTQAEADEGVMINIDLGTTAGVSEVIIERQVRGGGFEFLAALGSGELVAQSGFLDRNPFQGLNEYRAYVLFQNGEQIPTAVSSVYYLTTEPFLIFPNPVPRSERLNIFSRVFEDNVEVRLSVYDQAGLPLFDIALNSERESLNLERLRAGIYFYRITAGSYTHKGRIILE